MTTPVYQGTSAISARLNSDGGLDFQAISAQSTTNYTSFRFALRASQTGQQYEVYADASYGQPLRAPVSLTNYGGQPTSTGWTVYTIPLADLGANNQNVKDFTIHEARSVNEPALYVDQVELVGTSTQTTPTPTPTNFPTPTIATTPTPTRTPTPTITPTATVTPTPAPGGSTTPVYTDALQTNWSDASYNTTNTQVTTPVYQGTNAISSTMNANGGLDFQSINGMTTNTFVSLRFALRASQAGNNLKCMQTQPTASRLSIRFH